MHLQMCTCSATEKSKKTSRATKFNSTQTHQKLSKTCLLKCNQKIKKTVTNTETNTRQVTQEYIKTNVGQNRINVCVYASCKSFTTLARCALKHTFTTTKNAPQKSKNEKKHAQQTHATRGIIFLNYFIKHSPVKTTLNHQNKHNKVFGGHTQKSKSLHNGDNKFSCQVLRANQITGTTLSDQSENFSTCDK